MSKPQTLPENLPRKPATAPLILSCHNCKSDENYVILLEDEQTFYCTNCDTVVDDPIGTQPIKTINDESQHTRPIINEKMIRGD